MRARGVAGSSGPSSRFVPTSGRPGLPPRLAATAIVPPANRVAGDAERPIGTLPDRRAQLPVEKALHGPLPADAGEQSSPERLPKKPGFLGVADRVLRRQIVPRSSRHRRPCCSDQVSPAGRSRPRVALARYQSDDQRPKRCLARHETLRGFGAAERQRFRLDRATAYSCMRKCRGFSACSPRMVVLWPRHRSRQLRPA
jgi:hypothetical protein